MARKERPMNINYDARVVITSTVLVMAGCGGSTPLAGSGGSSSAPSAIGYSVCMRSHGVPGFPDPTANGPVLKADPQQLGVSPARYELARQGCQHLLPNTGTTEEQRQQTQCMTSGTCSLSTVQTWMTGLRALAMCLRSHGAPNWPDPVLTSQRLPHFRYDEAGIDHHSVSTLDKVKTCIRLTGFQGVPLP
jgi:hypothetical protein